MVEPTPFEKYARQLGSFPQVGVNIKHIWNHHLDRFDRSCNPTYNWYTGPSRTPKTSSFSAGPPHFVRNHIFDAEKWCIRGENATFIATGMDVMNLQNAAAGQQDLLGTDSFDAIYSGRYAKYWKKFPRYSNFTTIYIYIYEQNMRHCSLLSPHVGGEFQRNFQNSYGPTDYSGW